MGSSLVAVINCKVELPLSWNLNCVLSSLVGNLTFTITDAKLYVRVATLSIEDNTELSKLLSEGFQRSVYWNKYKIIRNKTYKTTKSKKYQQDKMMIIQQVVYWILLIFKKITD